MIIKLRLSLFCGWNTIVKLNAPDALWEETEMWGGEVKEVYLIPDVNCDYLFLVGESRAQVYELESINQILELPSYEYEYIKWGVEWTSDNSRTPSYFWGDVGGLFDMPNCQYIKICWTEIEEKLKSD